jgi:C1A family cysteine protease
MSVDILRDLRAEFGEARDQGSRPTCIAFAASDTHAGLRAGWEPLSVEWAYYHAVHRDGAKPDDGATLASMLKVLEVDGQPHETGWPYIAKSILDAAVWKPPPGVSLLFRRDSNRITATLDEIIGQLDAGVPVLMTMQLSDAFYLPGKDGIVNSAEKPDPKRKHAIVVVGHGVRASERMILARNSWGHDWGIAGYAWLTESYLTPRILQAAILTKEL